MSKKHRFGDSNKAIAKYSAELNEAEKSISHRRLRAKALCTHTKEPTVPDLTPRREGNKMTWVCRTCGKVVNLTRISDEDLKAAIETVDQACDMIKLMSQGKESDQKLVESVIADIQLKINAYLFNAYKSALNTSQKKGGDRNGNRRSRVTWSD